MKRFSDTIKLITETATQDSEGYDVITETEVEVFGSIESVKRTEFYLAMREGMKPNVVITVYTEDFALGNVTSNGKIVKPSKVKADDGTEYRIIRTYMTSDDKIELTCG